MARVSTNINLDPELKCSAQELFSDLGLDMTTAVTLFLKAALREQGIPFEISRKNETKSALAEYSRMIEHPEEYKRYKNFREAMDEVLTDA